MNFKEFQSEQKLRGGYYTPNDLADFLVRWVSARKPDKVLEPSCGDGAFFDGLNAHCANAELIAFELDVEEAGKARQKASELGLNKASIASEDFLGWALSAISKNTGGFDAVVGNPPFVRYQYLPEEFQLRSAEIFGALDCKFTKHTNAWVPFILASLALLKPGGRLAMVVPAEIIHVMHAQSLRTYVGNVCDRAVIIDPQELWFEGTLQGAVLFMAEKKQRAEKQGAGLGIYPVQGRSFLQLDPDVVFQQPRSINGKTVAGKWTRALLDQSTRDILDNLAERDSVQQFDSLAEVDVGIVTGANKFFLVDDATIDSFELSEWAHPMFGRSEHCPGVIYDDRQHSENARAGKPTNFVWFKDTSVERSATASTYIEKGEEAKLHQRYKCRIRKPWYSVPSVYSTEIGMLKRSHGAPRLILNEIGAFTTDTAYRIRSRTGDPARLVYAFINSLTALSAELEGRHYGGGVLELVPTEIERLMLPVLPEKISFDLRELDASIRTRNIDEVLESNSDIVLGALGVNKNDREALIHAWQKLRNRRHRVSDAAD